MNSLLNYVLMGVGFSLGAILVFWVLSTIDTAYYIIKKMGWKYYYKHKLWKFK